MTRQSSSLGNSGSILAIVTLALSACATILPSGVTVSRVNIASNYLPEELYVVATGGNELRTVIVGEPFDMPTEAFERAVLASMEGQNFGPRLSLSTNPSQEDSRKRQVVIAFNLQDVKQINGLCTNPAAAAATAPGTSPLTVTGVYCAGGNSSYLTQAMAKSGNVANIDSPQFHALMSQLAIALFPDENPHRQLDEGPAAIIQP